VLIDFGVARVRGPLQIGPDTTSGEFRGTLRYAAPESLDGQIDAVTDQFSLAVIAYEMLTGRHPFETDRLGALIEGIRTVEPRMVNEVQRDVPRGTALTIRRAMSKRRTDRFPDIASFAAALAKERARDLAGPRGRGWAGSVLGVALAGAAFGGYLVGARWPMGRLAQSSLPPIRTAVRAGPVDPSPATANSPEAKVVAPPDRVSLAKPLDDHSKKEKRRPSATRPLPAPSGFKSLDQ
jgi:serine/threonine-protein kinase